MTLSDREHPLPDPGQPEQDPRSPSSRDASPGPGPSPSDAVPPPAFRISAPSAEFHSAARPAPTDPYLPEDLRISWSWAHLIVFLFFGFVSLLAIQAVFAAYLASGHHWTRAQLEQALIADPDFIVGSNVLWFLFLLLFLYVTVGVLRGLPFWHSLGWRKFRQPKIGESNRPWLYLGGGCLLSLCVAAASSTVKSTGHIPIQDLFKSRNGALLLMAMAVLVAPVIEETVFRGYLYPLFANKFARVANRFGVDPAKAVRWGITGSIGVTGTLFGLLHGAQLGWTWGFVSLLIVVGIVFTLARARTGTVLASYLLHLGYNGTIAVTTIIATHGFREMPPMQ
ncbi:MAG TPA: CPBP family glutamic-type intramembrane protease [Candidatus Acidoferrales bacterium]|nr:CPBP family glutamic-type intramembrane protease [Candidatus Acidoferrales bacterium]